MEAVTSFLTRNVCSAYSAAVPAIVFLAAWASQNPQIFAKTDSEVVTIPKEEFVFKNGVILPHHEYLYGHSEASGHFVVGKKSAGYDYSAWEAEYSKFTQIKAVTVTNSTAKTTWTWSLETTEKVMGSKAFQLLFYFFITTFFVLFVRYLAHQFFGKSSRKNRDLLWRDTMLRMYQELKSELLSVQKLAAYYYDSSCKLEKALAGEKERNATAKRDAERAIQSLEDQIKTLAIENENLKAQLRAHAGNKGSTGASPQDNGGNVAPGPVEVLNADSADSQDPDIATSPGSASKANPDFVSPESDNSKGSDASVPLQEAPDGGLKLGTEYAPTPANQVAGSDASSNASGEWQSKVEEAGEKNGDSPAPESQNDGVPLGKPKKQRMNRRADGTVRTQNHPDYTPREIPAPRSPASGGRPFAGRGGGNGGGDRGRGDGLAGSSWGGGGRGGRGGNGGGRSGLRGGPGRGGRGRGGQGGPYAQYPRGRGQ